MSLTATRPDAEPHERNQHEHHPQLEKLVVAELLSGGVALTGLGLTAGTASAAPQNPGPTIDHSDYAGPVVECNQCGRTLAGDGSVTVTNPGAKFGNGLLLPAVRN